MLVADTDPVQSVRLFSHYTETPTRGSGGKKTILMNFKSLITVLLSLLAVCISQTSCSKSESEPDFIAVNPTTISLLSTENASATISVKSNGDWRVANTPSWINLSSNMGSENATITITAISDNDSSKPRTAEIDFYCGDATATLEVSQLAGLQANCNVIIKDELILSNSATFVLEFEPNVSYFFAGNLNQSAAGWSDERVITELTKDADDAFNTDTESISIGNDLTKDTKYGVYIIAFDSKGKRGDLIRHEYKTPKDDSKTPRTYLRDFSDTNSKWYWSTERNATATDYYMVVFDGIDAAYSIVMMSDAQIAMFIRDDKVDGIPYTNDRRFSVSRTDTPDWPYLYVATWSLRYDEFSPVIEKWFYEASTGRSGIANVAAIAGEKPSREGQMTAMSHEEAQRMANAMTIVKM